jgi:hypothetical protein
MGRKAPKELVLKVDRREYDVLLVPRDTPSPPEGIGAYVPGPNAIHGPSQKLPPEMRGGDDADISRETDRDDRA